MPKNSSDTPKKPGLIKSKIDHRSPSRFSMGVPVSAMRISALSLLTDFVCLAAGFLMACASSSTTNRHDVVSSQGVRVRKPQLVITRSKSANLSALYVSNFSDGAADGWTTTVFKLGANRE